MVIQNHYYKTMILSLGTMLGTIAMVGGILASNRVLAEDDTSVVDQINITVPVSCTISGTGQNSHNANINNGLYEDDIGSTTLHAFCNDNEGFAIYAAGYTGDEVGGQNSNKLVGTSASNNATIESGIATTAGNPDVSNWAMKLAISQDSGDTTGTNAFTIDSAPNVDLPSQAEQGATSASFSSYHVVPNEYTKVAHKNSGTDMTDTTGGVKLTTTYAAYISKTQAADTYSGQVKYTLVHPSIAVAGRLSVVYDGNGLVFADNKESNMVTYDANGGTEIVTKKSYAGSYNDEGSFVANYGNPPGVKSVTIEGAQRLHIVVTYGVPQNASGGPPSRFSINPGDSYNYATALTVCGEISAPGKLFSSNGSSGSQVTMECDVDGDSVSFLDDGGPTEGAVTTGYYAVVTGEIGAYTKVETFGAYSTPITTPGESVFLGWSTDPNTNANAEKILYVDEADFISNGPYTNEDMFVVLYAVWGKTFNGAYANANKKQSGGYYKMQDGNLNICREVYVGAIGTLIDARDNNTYTIGRLKDGNCWMLDNLALDPTDPTTAANMNESNTNATAAAINNLLNGGSSNAGWSSAAVLDVDTSFGSCVEPRINNASKDTLVTSYGLASTNGQAKVGIYYNYCAASASTYCYEDGQGIDAPDTLIDTLYDLCPINWRMPTGGNTGEYQALTQKYGSLNATNTNSVQYNLSTPLSGAYSGNNAYNQGIYGLYWSSTYYSNSAVNLQMFGPAFMLPSNTNRSGGYSMRCLIGK